MFRSSVVAACFCVLAGCNSTESGSTHLDSSIPSTGGVAGAAASGGVKGAGGAVGSGGVTAAGGSTTSTGGTVAGTGGKVAGTGGAATGGVLGSGGSTVGTGGAGTGGKIAGTGGSAGAATDAGTGSDVSNTGGARTGGSGSGGGGTGGSPGTGGSSSGNCTAPPDPSPLIGWASQSGSTTGGGSATPVTVTTLAELQSAAKGNTAAVIYVKGVMAAGSISVGSNKTIAGICGAEIHGHLGISSSNVILRNIKIVGYAVGDCSLDPSYDSGVGCSSGADAISVQSGHNIWLDHCDISDGTDGNLDITNGADFVTVSWTKFHYTPRTDNSGSDSTGASGHRYSNLVGGSDNSSGDVGKLNVTWHHNWWADNVVERQPRVRYGKNHVLNNLYTSSASNYCVRAGMDAQILVENNAFVGVKNPQQFNSTADQGTSTITAQGNLYSGTSGTQSTGGSGTPFTTPPYSYTPDATSGLQAAIQSGAGPK